MAMELKLDENNNAVLQEGKPVYVLDDGQEFVADVPSMHSNILTFKGQQKKDREQIKTLTGTLKLFDGVEDLATWKEGADKALATVKNLDDKTLVDAGKVEQVKAEVKEAYEHQVTQLKGTIKANEEGYSTKLAGKDRVIHKLTVGNRFANDPHFSGPEPVTNLPPDVAEAVFGPYFKVLPVDGADTVKVVGYINGNEILSKRADTIGEVADFGEAISIIIDQYPHKDRILAPGHSGSGAGGGEGGGGGGGKSDVDKLQAEYDLAVKESRGRDAVALKRKLFNARQEAARKK